MYCVGCMAVLSNTKRVHDLFVEPDTWQTSMEKRRSSRCLPISCGKSLCLFLSLCLLTSLRTKAFRHREFLG